MCALPVGNYLGSIRTQNSELRGSLLFDSWSTTHGLRTRPAFRWTHSRLPLSRTRWPIRLYPVLPTKQHVPQAANRTRLLVRLLSRQKQPTPTETTQQSHDGDATDATALLGSKNGEAQAQAEQQKAARSGVYGALHGKNSSSTDRPRPVIAVPFIGLVLDYTSTTFVLGLLVTIATAIGVLGVIPEMWAAYANVCLFVIYRPLYYTAVSDYSAKVFGFATFGKVYGLVVSLAGVLNFLQAGLDATTHKTFNNDPVPVNVVLLCAGSRSGYCSCRICLAQKLHDAQGEAGGGSGVCEGGAYSWSGC
ncbi:hypothetical protein L1887_63468 [Cichorium endivia]|nr:hypothetical protein L1887_63468 [Cichorium endivia]